MEFSSGFSFGFHLFLNVQIIPTEAGNEVSGKSFLYRVFHAAENKSSLHLVPLIHFLLTAVLKSQHTNEFSPRLSTPVKRQHAYLML